MTKGLKLVGLEVLFAIALLTLPAYMTGVAAYQKLRDQPGISEAAIRLHQDAALVWLHRGWSSPASSRWMALWQSRRRGRAARGLVAAATALSIVALVRHGSRGESRRRHPPSGDSGRRRGAAAPAAIRSDSWRRRSAT